MKVVITISLMVFFTGCTSFGKYPYPDKSNPKHPVEELSEQLPAVEPLTATLEKVCLLSVKRKKLGIFNTTLTSTGVLIDNRFIITAAHNVFDYDLSQVKKVNIKCGLINRNTNNLLINVDLKNIKNNIYTPRYVSKYPNQRKKFEYDYAFIDLGGKEDKTKNTFIVEDTDNLHLKYQSPVMIAGYPEDKPLQIGKGNFFDFDKNLVTYNINTYTGNSGGPVWVELEDGKAYLIAIHVKESTGRLINSQFIEDWREWKKSRQ